MPTFDLFLPPRRYSTWHRARPTPRSTIHPFSAASHLIARWIERVHQRRALAEMEDHMLRDIGITRVEAARECGKPFWL